MSSVPLGSKSGNAHVSAVKEGGGEGPPQPEELVVWLHTAPWELGWGDLWAISSAKAQQVSFSNIPFSVPSQGPESLASGQEVKAALSHGEST